MRIPYLPLKKSRPAKGKELQDASNKIVPDFSKDDGPDTKDKEYKPAVMRGLPEPPGEGDVVEFHHPKHGMKTRGRVTAVGQDGFKARVSDGSSLDVPHSHTIATLPVGDYGTDTGVSPQDAKESFLGPTREGGLPATPLQIAVMDVLAQYGFPINEEDIHTINYDQAKRMITKFLMDDRSVNQMPDTGESNANKDGAAGKGAPDMGQDDASGEEGLDNPGGGSDEESSEAPGGQQKPGMAPGTPQGPTGAPGPSSAPGAGPSSPPTSGAVSRDGTGGSDDDDDDDDKVEDDEGVMDDPEVKEAVEQLISALQTSSEVPGTPDPEETKGPQDAKKNPRVKSKIAALVNASNKRKPNGKKQ